MYHYKSDVVYCYYNYRNCILHEKNDTICRAPINKLANSINTSLCALGGWEMYKNKFQLPNSIMQNYLKVIKRATQFRINFVELPEEPKKWCNLILDYAIEYINNYYYNKPITINKNDVKNCIMSFYNLDKNNKIVISMCKMLYITYLDEPWTE